MAAAKNLESAVEIARTLRELAVLVENGELQLDPETLKHLAEDAQRLAKEAKHARFVAAFKETVDKNPEIFAALAK